MAHKYLMSDTMIIFLNPISPKYFFVKYNHISILRHFAYLLSRISNFIYLSRALLIGFPNIQETME